MSKARRKKNEETKRRFEAIKDLMSTFAMSTVAVVAAVTLIPASPKAQVTKVVALSEEIVYQVTVTDATGCIVIYNDTIVELSNLTGTMSGTDVLCNNAQTGNLEISAASGVAPYTYQWIGTNNTSTYVTSVGPGTYTCVVTDGLGCTDTVVTVLAVSNIAATASASNPLCYGTNTGSVTVSATGGTGHTAMTGQVQL